MLYSEKSEGLRYVVNGSIVEGVGVITKLSVKNSNFAEVAFECGNGKPVTAYASKSDIGAEAFEKLSNGAEGDTWFITGWLGGFGKINLSKGTEKSGSQSVEYLTWEKYEGKNGTVWVGDDKIRVINGNNGETFPPCDIKALIFDRIMSGRYARLTLVSNDNEFYIDFSLEKVENGQKLYEMLLDKKSDDTLFMKEYKDIKVLGEFKLRYHGGHPNLEARQVIFIKVLEQGIIIGSLGYRDSVFIQYKNISSMQYETEDQFRQRYTATRIALLGPMGLAFKQETRSTTKVLTIECNGLNDIPYIVILSGDEAEKMHASLYATLGKYRKEKNIINASENQANENNSTKSNPYEEIKQLKELLDMNILSQDEFDKKKKELLDI